MSKLEQSDKILVGRDEIAYYARISKNKFYRLLKLGFPANPLCGLWFAHKKNIDDYIEVATKRQTFPIPKDELMEYSAEEDETLPEDNNLGKAVNDI